MAVNQTTQEAWPPFLSSSVRGFFIFLKFLVFFCIFKNQLPRFQVIREAEDSSTPQCDSPVFICRFYIDIYRFIYSCFTYKMCIQVYTRVCMCRGHKRHYFGDLGGMFCSFPLRLLYPDCGEERRPCGGRLCCSLSLKADPLGPLPRW